MQIVIVKFNINKFDQNCEFDVVMQIAKHTVRE